MVDGMKTTSSAKQSHPARRGPREARLGIDIGRVIIAGDGPDTSFLGVPDDDAMRAPALEGAFEAIARLVADYDGRVWLVSKCGERVQQRTRRWLGHHRFFEATGVRPDRVRFCRERREKAPICAELGITCFIDDREDVLLAMAGVVPTRILFGAQVARGAGLSPARDWEVAEALARGCAFTEV